MDPQQTIVNKESLQEKFSTDALKELGEEEYEDCQERSLSFLSACEDSLHPRKPYVIYFKLFAEGYRCWQISYHYTRIRSTFNLAFALLKEGLEENKKKGLASQEDHDLLMKAFEHL